MFPTTYATTASLSELLSWVAGTQCLPEVHLLVQSLQEQLDFQG